MKELLQKALMSGLLRKITANEFVVLFGYVSGVIGDIAFEYLFNLSDRTMRRLNVHLNELGLLDKDGIQYKLNVDNTRIFLQQFVDSTKIEDKSSVEPNDSDKIDVEDNDSENLASNVDDSEKLACQNEPVGQNEPNDSDKTDVKSNYIPIELDCVEDKLSYMKNYFKELHSYPNGDDDWIKALDALKEACGGFTECLSHFEVNLGEHTIKTK